MSAHRRVRTNSLKVRRTFTAAVLAVATGAGFIAASGPAHAASTWWVATNGVNNTNCGTQAAPCLTVTFLIAKATFIDGDQINVQPGTYTDKPLFGGKTATVVGQGAGATFSGTSSTFAIGVAIAAAKTLTLQNLTLTLGKPANGAGGALVIATGKVSTTNVNLTNSPSTNLGGGAYVAAGQTLTMTGGTISGNSAVNGGGGIYNAGTTNLSGVTMTGNNSPLGGGIYAPAGGVTNVTNGSISSNNASGAGGGIYSLGTSVTVNGTTMNQNTSPLGAAAAFLGAVTFTGASITNNTSTNQGGALYNNTGILTVNGGTSITGNKAPTGAGIYQEAGTTNVTGSSIANNISSANGGGFYSKAGTFNATNTDLTGNTATTLGGAGIVLAGTSTITGGSVSNNTSLNGGALYNGGTTTIDGTTLTGNSANGGTTSNGGNAGAIYNAAALVVKNATFNGNKAVANTNAAPGVAGYGGAILSLSLAAAGAPTLSFTSTTINGDNAGTPVSGGNAVFGGAIAALGNIGAGGANTVVTANGLTLSKNVAAAAGGIITTGTTTLTNSLLSANQATHASAGIGGGVYASVSGAAPTITLDNTKVLANDGVAGGGGMVLAAGVTTVIKNGSVVGNNTGAVGAGVYNAGTLSVLGSHLDNNSASNSGGGIYSSSPVTLTNSSVDDNSAAFAGGGLSTTTTGGFTMTGGSVSGNDAFTAGGVLIGDNLTSSFDDTDFIGNASTGANFGGGAILSGGKLTIDHATISGNTADGASGSGGAIYSGSGNENVNTTLKVSNSTLTDNESFVGSAIFAGSTKASSTNKVSVSNSTVHANTATGPFGAIETTAPTSIVGSTITDNTAVPTSPFDAYGGIVAQSAGQVSLSGSVLSGNSGHQCNVTVADGGYNLNSPTASECGFSVVKNDVFALPQLGALASNGGPTQTRLPGPTSPALDKIPAATATGVSDAITGTAITLCGAGSDQRGTSRPQGAKCDIGSVEANQIAPTISGPSAATYSVGVAGAPQVFTTTGSPQPTLGASALPAGITFVDNGDGTGTLAGTPGSGTGGVYTITVTATNEAGSAPKTFTLTITQAPVIGGPAAATYTVGQAGGPTKFTQTTGHPLGIFSSIGALPSGVLFDDSVLGEGTYSGTPAAGTGGIYNLTVKDDNGTPPAATVPFTLTVNEAAGLTGPGSATFKVGTASSSTPDFVATGFPVPTLSSTGLPAGLSVVSTGSGTGKITGTAANGTGGSYPGVQVSATNGVGSPATKTVNVTVNEAPELVGPTEARFVTGTASSFGYSSDGFPQANIAQSGKPSWLSFTDNGNGSATFSGTAPANAVGTYAITITASNGQSPDAVVHLVLEVVPPLSISTTTLPNAAYHSAYSAQIMSSGGQPGYTYAITVGQLPAGLTMNQFGLITGSPTVSTGIYIFTVKATDSANPAQTDTKILKIQVTKGNTTTKPTAILLGFPANGDITINAGQVEADLTGGFPAQPIANATITFKSGTATVCSGKTDVKGHVKCNQNPLNAILTPLRGTLTATFAGDGNWNGSSGTTTLIAKG